MKKICLLILVLGNLCFAQEGFPDFEKNYLKLVSEFEQVRDSLDQIIQQKAFYENQVEKKREELKNATEAAKINSPKPEKDEFETTDQYKVRLREWKYAITQKTFAKQTELTAVNTELTKYKKGVEEAQNHLQLIDKHLDYLKAYPIKVKEVKFSDLTYDADKKEFAAKIEGSEGVYQLPMEDIEKAKALKSSNQSYPILFKGDLPFKLAYEGYHRFIMPSESYYDRRYGAGFNTYFANSNVVPAGLYKIVRMGEFYNVIIKEFWHRGGGDFLAPKCHLPTCMAKLTVKVDKDRKFEVRDLLLDDTSFKDKTMTLASGKQVPLLETFSKQLNNSSKIKEVLTDGCRDLFLRPSNNCREMTIRWKLRAN